jgi:hypothetical protein
MARGNTASVVAFDARPKEWTDSEALSWLRAQSGGHPANPVALGERWGWSRHRVARRLRAWEAAGLVARNGKLLTATVEQPAPAAVDQVPSVLLVAPAPEPGPEPLAPAPEPLAAAPDPLLPAAPVETLPGSPPVAAGGSRVIAAIVGTTALALAGVGLVLNASFAASLGQTGLAAALLATIGLAMDVLAVALPTAASRLWQTGHRLAALAGGCIWAGALMMMILAGIGFASTNIGDAVAGRAKIVNEGTALRARLEQLRGERAAVSEVRSVGALEAELQRAQPAAQPVWRATNGCRDVTLARSGEACAGVLRAREAIAAAQQRDALDVEIRELDRQLAALPAVRLDDPQARMTSDLARWLSGGWLAPSVDDIHRLRILGLTVAPSFAGLLLWMAVALWRRPTQ